MDAKEQFNNQAKFYSSSKTFSTGESLDILSNLFNKKKFKSGLDIGTGAGFAAFELSKSCEKVEATDISEGMINEAKKIILTPKGRQLIQSMGLTPKPMKRIKVTGNDASELIDKIFGELQ